MAPFPYKTQPWDHQREALEFLRGRRYAALFMEQRTGKTKVILDEAAHLFMRGRIEALIIVAPSGVHSNWVRDEIPLHLIDEVPRIVIEWSSGKANQIRWPAKVVKAIKVPDKLLILAINIEAIGTDKGVTLVRKILKTKRTILVIDESTDIKTPGAKRTKRLKSLGRLAAYRRILSGFPDPEGPMDMYSQLRFLSSDIVGSRAIDFRNRYGRYEQAYYGGDKPVQKLVGFQNLDELTEIISSVSFRVRRDDCMDLPDKVYTKRYFDMSVEQWRMYAELIEEWRTKHKDGEEVTAELGMVRRGRLQQISSGYVPTDNPLAQEPIRRIVGGQPRLEALKNILVGLDGSTIIWTRWVMDTNLICDWLGEEAYRYDGSVKAEAREIAKSGFQKQTRQYFVGNPRAAGRGLTLSTAQNVIYFSHHDSLEVRVQSEDRAIGKHRVYYVDLIARDTVDEVIIRRLREKNEVARPLLGDPIKDWI